METVAGYTKSDDSQGDSWFTRLTAKLDSVQISDYKEKNILQLYSSQVCIIPWHFLCSLTVFPFFLREFLFAMYACHNVINPRRKPRLTASVRLAAPSFVEIDEMWNFTVCSLI